MEQELHPNAGKNDIIEVDGVRYQRLPIKTHLITDKDNILDVAEKYGKPVLSKPGDVLFISEKCVACTQRRAIPLADIKPRKLAYKLSAHVTKTPHGIGLGMPETMEMALREVGSLRILFAAAISVIGKKIFRKKGWFYAVAGYRARSITGPAEEADAEGYVSALENAIASQPDAILTATLNIDPTVPKAKEAHDAGIVLNFVNCGLGNGDEGDEGTHGEYYNEFYYCSNTTIGEMAAQAFLDAMAEKGISTDKGTIGMQMNMENAALDFRMQGFRDYMAEKAPGLTLTDTEYNDNDSADAQADAENTINAVGADLIGIYAGNNVTCDGVCNALRAANMKEGVVSIGVDSDDVEIAALRDGFLSAIIVQDAFTQGYKCMENAILTLVNGQNPETSKQVNCPPVVVNMENIDSEKIQFMMSPYVK